MSLVKYLKKLSLAGFSYLPSELKLLVYRIMGAEIGKNVELGLGSFIIPFDGDFKKIHIGNDVVIDDGVQILSRHLFLGERAQIKNNTRIWGQSDFTAGKFAYIDQECHFDLRRNITLGNEVGIGGGGWFYTHMALHSVLEGAPSKFGEITIGDRTYMGGNVFVLPGITIGHDATIGARAVVTKDVVPDTVMMGNPAREVARTSQKAKTVTFEDKILITRDILNDFIFHYNEKITHIRPWDEHEMSFAFHGRVILFLPRIDTTSAMDEIMKKIKTSQILISFGIPHEIKRECDTNAIYWLDLESGFRSGKTNKDILSLEIFFENYGIRLV